MGKYDENRILALVLVKIPKKESTIFKGKNIGNVLVSVELVNVFDAKLRKSPVHKF
jgi:hypothetical protein